jgi:hypothetical protein
MSELILPVLRETKARLNKKGIEVEASIGEPATADEVAAFEGTTGLKLPPSSVEFFRQQGNGVWFSWQQSDEVWGQLFVDSLEQLASKYREWLNYVSDFADDPRSMDKCIDEPSLREDALRIWSGMKSWVPLVTDTEGDGFCLNAETGEVVLHRGDWFEGVGEVQKPNGLVAGGDIPQFMRNWSRFCFRPPSSLRWREFRNQERVSWDASKFEAAFTR